MARRVVSLIRTVPGAVRAVEPALEANAYAVAEDVDLDLVLRDDAVQLAVAGGEVPPAALGGVGLPPSASSHDVRALVESGVGVYADAAALTDRGIPDGALVGGVTPVDPPVLAELLRTADAVLVW